MSYNIRKGWPSEYAVDEVVKANTGETITDGMIVAVTGGKASKANFTGAAADTDPMVGFIIGIERNSGHLTAMMSQCVIEVDAKHYEAGSYTAGDYLTAKDGKFAAAGSSNRIARVMSFDAVSGILRVLWFDAK